MLAGAWNGAIHGPIVFRFSPSVSPGAGIVPGPVLKNRAVIGNKDQLVFRVDRHAVGICQQGPVSLQKPDGGFVILGHLAVYHHGVVVLYREEQFLRVLVHRDAKGPVRGGQLSIRRDVALCLGGKDYQRVLRVVIDRIKVAAGRVNIHPALELDLRVPSPDDTLRLGHAGPRRSVVQPVVHYNLEQILIGHDDFITDRIYRHGAVGHVRIVDDPHGFPLRGCQPCCLVRRRSLRARSKPFLLQRGGQTQRGAGGHPLARRPHLRQRHNRDQPRRAGLSPLEK